MLQVLEDVTPACVVFILCTTQQIYELTDIIILISFNNRLNYLLSNVKVKILFVFSCQFYTFKFFYGV